MSNYFMTGIGTGVGKTFSAAILTQALGADYWKPVQTGPIEDNDKNAVKRLVTHPATSFFNEAYTFHEPASPHLAAAMEGATIDIGKIILPQSKNKNLVIEGAGGLLVPLNEVNYVIDLAKKFDSEIILVCRNYLGCINHSLLSIDYLLKNKFKIKGLIFNGDFDSRVKSAILAYAHLPLLAEFPEISDITAEQVSRLSANIHMNFFNHAG